MKLSAGLCDTCKNFDIKQLGDGVSEPFTTIPFCYKKNKEIEPFPEAEKESRTLECDKYEEVK